MSQTVLILGAKGRFGRAAAIAFIEAGWQVKLMARSWQGANSVNSAPNVKHISGNALDRGILATSAVGVDVIVNALNPPYGRWAQDVPILTANVINAATASGATVMIPGNVYNYGEGMPPVLREMTKHAPSTHLGQLRKDMEQAYHSAGSNGVQTIVLRAGDFIEGVDTGNWFESQMINKVNSGKITYPGPLDQMHAWAYLPDLGCAMEALAAKRSELGMFEEFGFEGFNVTGAELVAATQQAWGKPLKVKTMPWWAVKLLARMNADMAGVVAMSYLWHTPHSIDGSKLARTLPNFTPTPLNAVLANVLRSSAASEAA